MSGGAIAGIFVLVLFICILIAGLGGYCYVKNKPNGEIGTISINPDYHSNGVKT